MKIGTNDDVATRHRQMRVKKSKVGKSRIDEMAQRSCGSEEKMREQANKRG